MKVVAIHEIVYGKSQVAKPGTAFDIDGDDLAALLATGAVREITEAEAALWGSPEADEAPKTDKANGKGKGKAKAEAEPEAEAEAETSSEDLL